MIVKEYDCQRIELANNSKDGIIRTAGRASKYGLERGPRKNVRSLVYYQTPLGSSPPGLDFFTKKFTSIFVLENCIFKF